MSSLLPNAFGLSWKANNVPGESRSKAMAMQDLIDPRQIDLFDAIEKLSGLKVASDIEIPQLAVVGDQSSGKSSVLEAIGRFHFPVDDQLCTRFPIKLKVRPAAESQMHFSIEPGLSRTAEDKIRLQQFQGSLSSMSEFGEKMKLAAEVLGVRSTAGPESPTDTPGDSLMSFTDDVLVVEVFGPNLPLVNLIDLPGLFQAKSTTQNEASKETVMKMVDKYIRAESNLILLVVSARNSFHNYAGLATIQAIAEKQPELTDRVVGVITSPDYALSPAETLSILRGELDSTNLKCRWHVVRNQDQDERKRESLLQRDEREEQFFSTSRRWKEIPKSQRGIAALVATLRETFWAHTRAALPTLASKVRARVTAVESRLVTMSHPRSTDLARRQYLHGIARKFEALTREACKGTYEDEKCKELHRVGQFCRVCERFFPFFGDDSPESQDRNLRANVRALSKTFASAMREFGRTKEVGDRGDDPQDSAKPMQDVARNTNVIRLSKPYFSVQINVPGREDAPKDEPATSQEDVIRGKPTLQQSGQHQEFPAQDVIQKYYSHNKPEVVDRKEYEEWLAAEIPRWRGSEPQGEASEAIYQRYFEFQSWKWSRIAAGHLDAVWKAVKRFVNLALNAACAGDEDTRQALQRYLTTPRINRLEAMSHRSMNDLLDCHGKGRTGFYDSFVVDPRPMRQCTEEIASSFAVLRSKYEGENHQGRPGDGLALDKIFGLAIDAVGGIVAAQTGLGGLVGPILLGTVKETVLHNLQSGGGRKSQRIEVVDPQDVTATRVIKHVEAYYEKSLASFVGYVNSLVVENGILHELPIAILTQGHIMGESEAVVEKIAGEREADVKQREREERDLKTMKDVMEVLEGYEERYERFEDDM
ncbi:P-loop containing nucleoside triphosphate hydrolase protein [Lasiosphaeria hispida]|uniref:P-loop containing nucleoside triphosphate hydrolase protein n=1 Tax=Lasiosphaeria hispida TaxID=260671 RepID=A0AAJ0MH16_9PEZI|nr:P-loop containing nucleoside triphosphate hydrolase protein [Lasiosphaeria hispida]